MFKFISYLFVVSIFVIGLSSCGSNGDSPILNEKINDINLPELTKSLAEDENVTKEQLDHFNNALNRNATNFNDSIVGKTVGELINQEVKKIRDNQNINLISNANRILINNALVFGISKFEPFDQPDGTTVNLAVYQFSNKSAKDIKSILGAMELYNQSGQIVKRFTIEINDLLPANKTLTKNYPYPHDNNNQRDMIVRENLSALKVTWRPYQVEFTDGTKLIVDLNKL